MNKERKTLSPGELEILEILWTDGDLSLRETQEAFLARGRKISYSTVQTRLERMMKKGLLARSREFGGKYRPTLARENVSGKFLDLVETLCGGNFVPLMVHLAEKRKFTPDEITAMKQLLDDMEQ